MVTEEIAVWPIGGYLAGAAEPCSVFTASIAAYAFANSLRRILAALLCDILQEFLRSSAKTCLEVSGKTVLSVQGG
jgi:hypothetical protein